MIKQILGQTDLEVSRISFGAAPLGDEYGRVDPETGKRAVHAALDHGINFFDTSLYYGRTLSETRLGEALKGKRDKAIIATKGGRYDFDRFDFSAERLLKSIDESLTRLQTDVIDLYQLHDIEFTHQAQITDEALPALEKIKAQGKIRFIGMSGYPLHMLKSVADLHQVDSILSYCHYNLLNTTLEDVLIPWAKENGIGLINASSLHMGILTENGAPAWHPAPQIVHDAAAQAAALCKDFGTPLADLALQFAFSNRTIPTTLVGMKTAEQVENNVRLLDTPPAAELLQKVETLLAPVKNINWLSGLPENHEPGAMPHRLS